MSSKADAGLKAMDEGKYEEAIKLYTDALTSSKSPLWLIQRSTAYQRTKQYDLALKDAEAALVAAIERARREQIATAQFRRAIALYKLGRLGDARMALNWARLKNDKEKGLSTWTAMVVRDFDATSEDDPKRKITITEVPGRKDKHTVSDEILGEPVKAPAVCQAGPKSASASTPLEKIRMDWYQNASTVSIMIMARDIPKDATKVKIGDETLDVSFPVGSGEKYELHINPLFDHVHSPNSTYNITPTKLEISLQKKPCIKWAKLEGTTIPREAPIQFTSVNITHTEEKPSEKPPAYPTSSKNGPKNWDSMKSFTMTDDTGKTEKVEVKDDDDLGDGDELNGFFKKLYRDASPDTRRAMLKSYQESNGTSLSTNWKDVGSKSFKPEN